MRTTSRTNSRRSFIAAGAAALVAAGAIAVGGVGIAQAGTTDQAVIKVRPVAEVGTTSKIIGTGVRPGTKVQIAVSRDKGAHWKRLGSVKANSAGKYTIRWTPTAAGRTIISAGIASSHSVIATTKVKVIPSTVKVHVTPAPKVGATSTIAGRSPGADKVEISVSNDNGTTWTRLGTVVADRSGNYSVNWVPTVAGSTLVVAGNPDSQSVIDSTTVTVAAK